VDFGRLEPGAPALDRVDFSLPPITARGVGASSSTEPLVARIGAPAWSSRAYLGKLYPKGTKPADYLARYAERFASIELNATFHRAPDERTVASWRASVPASFRFCPKLYRAIGDRLDRDNARAFFTTIQGFGDTLGPSFLQLGPGFGPERLGELTAFLDAVVTPESRLAVEVRHPGFFTRDGLLSSFAAVLADRGVGAVITDTAGRRDACHGVITAPFVIVRFQGNEGHASDAARARAWAVWLADVRAKKAASEAYLFVHQPDDALAPETLAVFARELDAVGLPAIPRPPRVDLGPLFSR
jgi:uncharacterized protein YecE (DUF72 family)